MKVLLLVLDSVGCGHAPDAEAYGDAGANTLGHILEQVPDIHLPNLRRFGLATALELAAGKKVALPPGTPAAVGVMTERSAGKDTTTGHWEIAGVVLDEPFAVFEKFPAALVEAIEREAGVEFIGNFPASGTTVIENLGGEHCRTGKPILYTSADSVMQIAAHEEIIPIERHYAICGIARAHCDAHRIGRVIARPFIGEPGNFQRTSNRHDFSLVPPPTILNALCDAGHKVIGVGKISDIFAASGITESHPTKSNAEGMEVVDRLWATEPQGLIFANLVDFDMHFGHRRDVAGYARALEAFDQWLGAFPPQCGPGGAVIITADHGNDPTHRGTDHTREKVPLFVLDEAGPRLLGDRQTFADIAASLAGYFNLPPPPPGTSFHPASA